MKSMWLALAVAWVTSMAMGVAAAPPGKAKADKGKAELRHVVAFRFKDTAKPEDVRRVEDAFAGLKNKIPQIQRYEWGLNNSPEGLNKGLTHAFVLTFASEKARDEYLVHPDHKAFGALLRPFLADVFVIDFLVRR
ncbi:MAG: Dabb family protein [Verrucomicrobia bacterium]|nr:MAG: Dabb family protein [Verrucomicrobiota bacterium]